MHFVRAIYIIDNENEESLVYLEELHICKEQLSLLKSTGWEISNYNVWRNRNINNCIININKNDKSNLHNPI